MISLIEKLKKLTEKPATKNAVCGFDGFVDRIIRPVKKQTETGNEFFPTIDEYATHLQKLAGKSGQIELVQETIKLGGNAPNMAESMGKLGIQNNCIGAMGHPDIHPVFNKLDKNCRITSVADPGMTDAYEFYDGKLIQSELSPLKKLNWEQIKSITGIDLLLSLFNDADIIALVDWCNLHNGTIIWQGIADEILPELTNEKIIFFDIADPSKKTKQDVVDVLNLMRKCSNFGKTVFGINENETNRLYEMIFEQSNKPLLEKGQDIFK